MRYQEYDIDGNLVKEYEIEQPIIVPKTIPVREARKYAIQIGLDEDIEALIASIEDDKERKIAQNYWEYSFEFNRDDEELKIIAAALNWDDDMLDLFFMGGE